MADRYRLVAPDLPGFVRSDRSYWRDPSARTSAPTARPPLLAIWGRNDPFFLPAGAEAFRRDVPGADIRLSLAGELGEHLAAPEAGLFVSADEDPRLRDTVAGLRCDASGVRRLGAAGVPWRAVWDEAPRRVRRSFRFASLLVAAASAAEDPYSDVDRIADVAGGSG